ncbi:MAG: magnesium transporter MgtE N-terminal domain-containing protein [Chloroflexota bacterium]
MAFLSQIIGRPVTDRDGAAVGVLKDIIARPLEPIPHPVVQAIVIDRHGSLLTLPYSDVAALLSRAVPLKSSVADVQPYESAAEDIFLARDVLDKQIIDTDGARVVRVNDLELVRVNDTVLVSNVDVGVTGILRRLGLNWIGSRLGARFEAMHSFISWDDMELFQQDSMMRLRVPAQKIKDLHPADIAEIISDLNRLQSTQLLESFDIEQLADALQEVEPEFQASLIENMDDERLADVLEEMDPDDAADLLAELDPERSEDLLELMEDEDAEDVRRLLQYPEDSAGGIMTTEYATVPPGLNAAQALDHLRANATEAETLFYVYIVDVLEHLIGVCSLSHLVLAPPDTPIAGIMKTNLVTVELQDDQDDVAQVVSKYNLLAVPVVDSHNRLHGIVTADDALDKIIPTAWKKRLPRFYH